ncbi:hypothetical protein Aperf_G00000112175 [Anoplocephala perfoliata]
MRSVLVNEATMHLGYLCSLVFLVGIVRSEECPDGFFRISSSCYFIYNGTKDLYSWSESREQCKMLHPDADLLEIHDQQTQQSLNVVLSLISWPIWIGLRSNTSAVLGAAAYRWISSDQPLNFANWANDAFLDGGIDVERHCAFLSTSSLRVGTWDRCNCDKNRMGFGCEVPLNTLSISNVTSTTSLEGAKPIWSQPENSDGYICYLGTCYRLLPNASADASIEEAKDACGENAIALPRNPLELAFLRTRLAHASNSSRAWVGIEVTNTKDRLEFTRTAEITPWLTAAIHQSQPVFMNTPSNHSEKLCFQFDVNVTLVPAPFLAAPCVEYEGDEEWEEEEASYNSMDEAPMVTAFCAVPETPVVGDCPKSNGAGEIVKWHAFENRCFAVMGDCNGDAAPASLKYPAVDAFVTWMLSARLRIEDEVLIGGIVNSTSPLTITWLDGSIGEFNRLKPTCFQKNASQDGLCVAIEPRSGWWVLRECKGHRAPRLTLCSVPIRPINPALTTLPPKTTKSESPCPDEYLALNHKDGSTTCFRVILGGSRSHSHDWRMSERACRQSAASSDEKGQWQGHLASLPNRTIFDDVINLLQKNDFVAGVLDVANNLPAHMLKPSEFVWIGLSKSYDNYFWNNWTDGSQGSPKFYGDRLMHQDLFFTDPSSYFFDHGSCIALHLPSGSWYALRCTLDLGYLCQATMISKNQTDIPSDHFDTPNCLVSSSTRKTPPLETGFIHEPDVDCIAEGFVYFNGQCFRAFHDKFMTFTEAQTHCHELSSPFSKNGNGGLAIFRSEADQLFVVSQLSRLPRLPTSTALYGRGSTIYDRLEVIWRRYHWIGMFHYRHAFHSVDERMPCYIAHELNRPLVSSSESPLCVSIKGVPDSDHFGTLSFDIGCGERLPFVCSFVPAQTRLTAKTSPSVCPKGYATHRAATGDHCYLFMGDFTGSYEEAEAMCGQTANGARLAALTTPFTVAWMRAHLPSDHKNLGTLPWESVPHWIGLKIPAHDASSWKWSNGLPVTHTRWSTRPINVVDSDVDTCFAFSKSISMTSYELDMVAVNCSRKLSPLCEADPVTTTRIPTLEIDESQPESEQNDGAEYLAVSESGKACIRWDLISPTNSSEMDALQRGFHDDTLSAVSATLESNSSTPADLKSFAFQPAFSAASNWCRNPGSLRDRAFCYTAVDHWEFCKLPEEHQSIKPNSQSKSSPMNLQKTSTIIGIIFGSLLIAFLCLIFVFYLHRKSRRTWASNYPIQEMFLRRMPFAWRWNRSESRPCLLADNVSYNAGTMTTSTTNNNNGITVASEPKV